MKCLRALTHLSSSIYTHRIGQLSALRWLSCHDLYHDVLPHAANVHVDTSTSVSNIRLLSILKGLLTETVISLGAPTARTPSFPGIQVPQAPTPNKPCRVLRTIPAGVNREPYVPCAVFRAPTRSPLAAQRSPHITSPFTLAYSCTYSPYTIIYLVNGCRLRCDEQGSIPGYFPAKKHTLEASKVCTRLSFLTKCHPII
jgi:hypothetical protein